MEGALRCGRPACPGSLTGRPVHARIGRSLEAAASGLRTAKQAGVAPARGSERDRDPGLSALVALVFRRVARFLGRVDGPTYRFYLQALREADPAFGKEAPPSEKWMSLEWLVRDARRAESEALKERSEKIWTAQRS